MITESSPLGAPVTDLDEFVTTRSRATCRPDPEPLDPAPSQHDPPGRPAHRWIAVPAILVGLVAAWILGRSTTTPGAIADLAEFTTPEGLTGFAEMYVAAYLTGADETTLRTFTAIEHDGRPAAHDRYVTRTAAIDVEALGDDYWAVTVAADVLHRVDGGYGPGAIEYFDVAVAVVGSGFLATGTPLPVAAPAASVPYGTYAELKSNEDDGVADFLDEFLEAYLGGNGRLPRLVTPDAAINAVVPPPAATVEVRSIRTGEIDGVAWVTANAIITDTRGSEFPVSATVSLAATPDGARVAEILPGPPPLPTSTD